MAVGGEVGGQSEARAFGCVGDEGAGVAFRAGMGRHVGFAFEAQAAGDLFDGRHDVVGNLVVAAQSHAFTEHGFDIDSLEHAGGGDDGFECAELLVGEGAQWRLRRGGGFRGGARELALRIPVAFDVHTIVGDDEGLDGVGGPRPIVSAVAVGDVVASEGLDRIVVGGHEDSTFPLWSQMFSV